MTKKEYAEVRDIFTDALRSLREVEAVFCEVPNEGAWSKEPERELWDILEEDGYWLSGRDLDELNASIKFIEGLIGRAHGRAS